MMDELCMLAGPPQTRPPASDAATTLEALVEDVEEYAAIAYITGAYSAKGVNRTPKGKTATTKRLNLYHKLALTLYGPKADRHAMSTLLNRFGQAFYDTGVYWATNRHFSEDGKAATLEADRLWDQMQEYCALA